MPICIRVWRQPHESMDPACQQGTVQAGGGSVMVWGVCNWRDMGPLIRLDTTLTGDRYVSILSGHLHPFMSIVYSDGLGEFQQDNATPHTSRIATEWLQEHSSDFRHFRWPPKSSDMNIIEHIWDALQRAVQKRSHHPLTPTDLWTALQDSWCQLPPALLQTSVDCMPRRVAAFMVSITSSTASDISRFHATSCCGTSACSRGPYTILGRCTSFFGSSV
ncbi:Transposable element Tcb2 transposase [Araneus ventricosus]|uniref:Transposable element Tcb2 transposase n=1 Tax=Araneus ventricosus TaxID=182803 RepID=A0A4Y2NE11_ARAVE|nr:Transposable element Tcb2 transposase [Araneus ventricosus]